MDIQKPNDIFAVTLQKPDVDIFDLSKSNISPENTQLLDKDTYKSSSTIQNMFKTQDGSFDEVAFNNAYLNAAKMYNDLSTTKSLASALEYDPLDYTAPTNSKKIDTRGVIKNDINPFKSYYSRTGINSIDENDLSIRELAQQGNIFDTKSGKFLDKSVNDLNLFEKFFGETYVYAQWDEDGVDEKGRKHNKGDYKFDNSGNLYVETLGDREIYGKQIVNPTDILTTEGSTLNSIDFWDSDGKSKSALGTTMKIATQIAPYFIPGAGIYYGGFNMAIGLASVLPTFAKAVEGIFGGDQKPGSESEMWKAMTKAEGYMKKYTDNSFSDESQGSMWNYEQMGQIVADVFSQINEQRAAASLSKLFYKSNEAARLSKIKDITDETIKDAAYAGLIKSEKQAEDIVKRSFLKSLEITGEASKQSQLAKSLNLGYMALTQSSDVYGEAVMNGYDARTAGMTALGAMVGQYALMMNNPMGDWFLDKTTGFSANETKGEIARIVKKMIPEAKESIDIFDIDKVAGKKAIGNWFGKIRDTVLKTNFEEYEGLERMFKSAIIEGVEEVTEEAAIDVSKGITDFLSYVGFTGKKGSFGGWSNVFSEEGASRYLSSLVGGAIGGPLFELERSGLKAFKKTEIDTKTQLDELDFIANGKKQELFDYMDKNKSKFGSTDLSPVIININGEDVYMPAGKNEKSQADYVIDGIKARLNNIEKIMHTEGLTDSDEDIIKKGVVNQIYINDLRKSNVDKFLLSDAKILKSEIVNLKKEISELSENSNSESESKTESSNPKIKELLGKLNEKKEEFNDLISGKKSEYYHKLSLFSLNSGLHMPFISLSVDEYVKNEYNKNYYELSEVEKNKYKDEFDDVMKQNEGNFKEKMKAMYKSFEKFNSKFSKALKKYDEDGYASVKSQFFNMLHTLNNDNGSFDYIKALSRLNETNKLFENTPFSKHTLSSDDYISVGKFLIDSGFINEGLSEDEKKKISDEFKVKLFNHLNIDESLPQEEIKNNIALSIARNKIAEKLKSHDLFKHNLLLDHVLNNEEEEEENLFDMFDVDNLNKLKLSPEEKRVLYQYYESDISKYQLYNNIINFFNSGSEITPEFVSSLGLNPALDGDGNFDKDENLKLVNKLYTDLDTFINDNKNSKVDLTVDDKLNEILKDEEKLNETRTLADNNKELAISFLDRINLPSSELRPELLTEAIEKFNKENDLAIAYWTNEVNAKEDGAEKDAELKHLEELRRLPKLKVNSNATLVSPKRALLLNYAEQQIKKGEALSEETVQMANDEIKKLEKIIADHNTPGEEFDYAKSELKKLEKITNYKNIKTNELLEVLKKFEIEIYGWSGPASFFDILKENINSFNAIDVQSDFVKTDIQLEQIKRALHAINGIRSVIIAMNSTKWGTNNLYGMNVMLNKALEKEGKKPEYEYLESQAIDTLNKELNQIEAKLNYFKHLILNNSKSIVQRDNDIKNAVLEGTIKQYFDEKNKLSLINLTINGKSLFSPKEIEELSAIEDLELKTIKTESLFFTKFHELPGTIDDKLNDLFKDFIDDKDKEQSVKDLIESPNSDLTVEFKQYELFDWYKHIHYILSTNTNNFYIKYKKYIENELSLTSDKKAALFTQLLSQKQVYGYFENKEIIGHITKFIQPVIDESKLTSDNFDSALEQINNLDSFTIQNILTILGSGGTGKSSVIANSTLRMILDSKLLGEYVDVIAIAPSEDTLNVLNKDIKGSLNIKIESKTKDQFIESLLTDEGIVLYKETLKIISENNLNDTTVIRGLNVPKINDKLNSEYFIAGDAQGAILITQKFFDKYLKKPSDKYIPKLVIGDEMSKFTTLEWQIINQISKKTDNPVDPYYITLMGDELQSGVMIGKNNFSTENIFSATTTKMRSPIRAKNDVKSENNVILENFTNKVIRNIFYNKGDKPKEFTLKYYEKGDFLKGDKIVNTITKEDLLKLDPAKQIVIFSDSGEISKDLNDKLKSVFPELKPLVLKSTETQGREFDQVILDNVDLSIYDSLSIQIKLLNTLISRSKHCTLGQLKFSDVWKLNSEQSKSSTEIIINQDIIEESLKNRLEYLNSLNLEEVKSSGTSSKPPVETEGTENIKKEPEEEFKEPENLEDLKTEPLYENENNKEIPVVNTNEDEDEDEDEDENENKDAIFTSKDGIMLAYSFFNNLGLTNVNVNVLEPYLNFEISKVSDEANGKISWEDLKIKIKEYLPENGSDLFNLNINPVGKSLEEIINDYIKFKNALLFNKDYSGTLFGDKISIDKNWVLKRISDPNDPNFPAQLLSYGKIANSVINDNWIHAIGTYITINGKKTFITLSVTPNEKNPNIPSNIADKLNALYDLITNKESKEIIINKHSIESSNNVNIVKDKQTKKSIIHEVEIENLHKVYNGLESVSEVKIFRDDIAFIKNQLEKYNLSKDDNGNYIEISENVLKSYRFRPYVEVTYLKNSVKQTRIVFLNNKKRTLKEFWSKFIELKNVEKDDAKHNRQLGSLITKYRSWEILFNLINHWKKDDLSQDWKEQLEFIFESIYGLNIFKTLPYSNLLTELGNYVWNPHLNNSDNFKECIKSLSKINQGIINNSKSVVEQSNYKWANVLHYVARIPENSELYKSTKKFFEDDENPIKFVYTNPLITSSGIEGEGKSYGILDKDLWHNYNMNIIVEPNLMLIKLEDLIDFTKDSNKNSSDSTDIISDESNLQNNDNNDDSSVKDLINNHIKDLSDNSEVVYSDQINIDYIINNSWSYNFIQNNDGSIKVIGILNPKTSSWLGIHPVNDNINNSLFLKIFEDSKNSKLIYENNFEFEYDSSESNEVIELWKNTVKNTLFTFFNIESNRNSIYKDDINDEYLIDVKNQELNLTHNIQLLLNKDTGWTQIKDASGNIIFNINSNEVFKNIGDDSSSEYCKI